MARMRTVGRGVALGAVALLMTGCIKLDMDLEVSSDDTVSGTVIFGFSKQLLTLTGQDPSQVIQGSGEEVPASGAPGVSTSSYEDDQFAGEKVTYDDVDLDLFNQGDAADSLKIERVGDEFHVSGALDVSDTGSRDNPLGDAAVQALSSAQLSIKLTFPGAVVSSNGAIDGNTVTWVPKAGEKTELTAVASAIGSSGGISMWLVVAVGVIVLLLVVAAIVVSRRMRAAESSVPAAPRPS